MVNVFDRRFAFIFDLDGVLVDSMENYYLSFKQVFLDRFGVEVERDYYLAMAGMSEIGQIDAICERFHIAADKEDLLNAIHDYYLSIMHSGKPILCNIQLLKLLMDNGFPVAIASGSSMDVIQACLKACGIEGVQTIVSIDDVTNCKPHPEAFLLAAKKLGFDPKDCVVIEDSDVGEQAAKAANMRLLRFYDTRE
ncbi:MAG: HAD family hydrolase [Christensenellales bacterium]|jgi:beta-phosphoglucomutase-like phosphatase (HAD superfamily)